MPERDGDAVRCGAGEGGRGGGGRLSPGTRNVCCACPEEKERRDECVVLHGEQHCASVILAHRLCLRAHGFKAFESDDQANLAKIFLELRHANSFGERFCHEMSLNSSQVRGYLVAALADVIKELMTNLRKQREGNKEISAIRAFATVILFLQRLSYFDLVISNYKIFKLEQLSSDSVLYELIREKKTFLSFLTLVPRSPADPARIPQIIQSSLSIPGQR